MNKNTLSFKIIFWTLLFTILLGGTIISVYYYFTRTEIENSSRDHAISLAENTVNRIEEVIRPAAMIPDNLAWMMEAEAIPHDSIAEFLALLLKHNPDIYASAVAFEPDIFAPGVKAFAPYAYRHEGEIRTTDLWSPDYNYFIMDWYQIPSILQQSYWSEPYFDQGGADALLTTYSVPFFVQQGGERKLGGIITIDISLDWLTEIVNSVKIFDTGYAFLISRNGVYVTHPFRHYIMNETVFTMAKEQNQPQMRDIGRNMLAGRSDFTQLELVDRGKVWMYYTQLPSTQWSIGVVYPHSEMYAGLLRINLIILLLSLSALALITFYTIRIINKLVRPLTHFTDAAHTIAGGDFKAALPEPGTTTEIRELHDSFAYMQKELGEYMQHLQDTTSAKEKIESELRIAKEIQMGMIPHIFPPFPNLHEIDLYASLVSAKEVGGDLYDFFLLDDHLLCFAIGDVSGKGIPASLFMAVTRTLLRSVADRHLEAADIVSSINKTLSINNESNMFVTFFLGILDVNKGVISYCNAGHNPPVVIRNRTKVEFFPITRSIPLGLFESQNYSCETMRIAAGDQIFLYTDGLTEAEDKDNNLFGDEHLLDVLRQNRMEGPQAMIRQVDHAVSVHVNGHEQSDDLTMLCITYFGKDGNFQNADHKE